MFAATTTLTSCGAVDSFHDSYTSLGGMIPLFNMQLGEVAPGGIGSGLYGMLILAVITVFVARLMVGSTAEYLGKKIAPREILLAASYCLVTPLIVLIGTATAMALPGERAGVLNSGPHGLSEVLYAFTSAANNNGSAFAGLKRQHRPVQHRPRAGDGIRPIPANRSCARPGRLARQAGHHAGIGGHTAHPSATVRRHGRRRSASPAGRSDRQSCPPTAAAPTAPGVGVHNPL